MAVTAAYAFLLAVLLSQHEMWADEIQAWLLARDSDGVAGLLANLRYEGHPPLWHLLLLPLTRLANNPAIMQSAHWVVAVATVFIIVRHAPFSKWQRGLLPFGYYPLFEYGAVSRNYALGFLLAVAACSLFSRWRRRPWRLGAILLLMSLTSAHACILVIGLVAGLALDWALAQKDAGRPLRGAAPLDWNPVGGLALAIAGVALFVLLVYPAADAGPHAEWRWRLDPALLGATFAAAASAFAPPMEVPRFWFAPGEAAVPFLPGALIFLPLLCLIAAVHVKRPPALCVYLVCVAGLAAFCYLKLIGHSRHHGFFLIAFLLLCWGRATLWRAPTPAPPRLGRWRSAVALLMTLWLAAHAVSGVRIAVEDLGRPFANAKAAAAFIDDRGLSDMPMLGTYDAVVNGVVGHLRRKRSVRYVQGNRDGTFARRIAGKMTEPSDAAVLALARELANAKREPVLVIDANRPLVPSALERPRVQHLASFTGAMAGRDLHLYIYRPPSTDRDLPQSRPQPQPQPHS